MNVEALERLAAKLESFDLTGNVGFDMGVWFHENECATSACAAGHACMDPWFQKQGLHLANAFPSSKSVRPVYGDSNGFAALEKFFDLPVKEVHTSFWDDPPGYDDGQRVVFYLFSPGSYDSLYGDPHEVAKRIREVIRRRHELEEVSAHANS